MIRTNQVVRAKYSASFKLLSYNEIRLRGSCPKRNIRSTINLDVNKRNLLRILCSIVNLSLNPKGREMGVVFALKSGNRDRLIGLCSYLKIK